MTVNYTSNPGAGHHYVAKHNETLLTNNELFLCNLDRVLWSFIEILNLVLTL